MYIERPTILEEIEDEGKKFNDLLEAQEKALKEFREGSITIEEDDGYPD